MGSWILEGGIQQVRCLLVGMLLLLAVPAQAQNELAERAQARRFETQVVRVLPRRSDGATAQPGFGIIVGQLDRTLIIAVPAHVVWDTADQLTDRPMVRFHVDRFTDVEARRFPRRMPPPDDLALLEVPLRAGMTPPRAALVEQAALANRFVWSIGSGDDWEISARAGTYEGEELNRQLRFGGLNITPGQSGGAIVTSDGIVAMVLTTTGSRSFAVPASRIAQVFAQWDRRAGLLGPNPSSPIPPPELRAGEVLRDCTACPELVVVPSGSFTMGSPATATNSATSEQPARPVRVASFAAGRFEVTFAEWDACVAAGGCGGYRPSDEGWGRGNRPVINVSWRDAQAYVSWLSQRTGKRYRLLSEAEWEYAARAGTITEFWTGPLIRPEQAQYDWSQSLNGSPTRATRPLGTAPVGSFPANSFGLHDMHGNVFEWVQDCYRDGYAGAPADSRAMEAASCDRRVMRGGGWAHDPFDLRSANRRDVPSGDRFGGLGFRVARTL